MIAEDPRRLLRLAACAVVAGLALWVAGPAKAGMSVADFATGFELQPQAVGDLHRVELSAEVYKAARLRGLADLAVFNAKGQRLPHRLSTPLEPPPAPAEVELRLFPLARADLDQPERLRLRLLQSEGGLGLALDVEAGEAGQARLRIPAYLLDRGDRPVPLQALRLQWEGPPGMDLIRVGIEASADLQRWRPLAAAAVLADLSFDQHRLLRDQLPLPPTDARYLRLMWPETAQAQRLRRVVGVAAVSRPAPRLQWMNLDAVEAVEPGMLAFENPGRLPISAIGLRTGDAPFVSQLQLESSRDGRQSWRRRAGDLVYQLRLPVADGSEASELRQLEVNLDQASDDADWRLGLRPPPGETPGLRIGWPAQQLVFLTDGVAPYLLAIGNPEAEPVPPALDQGLSRLLDDPGSLPLARLGAARPLGGEPPWWRQLLASPALLWAVLLLGLLLLAAMAISLFRQMRQTPPGDPRGGGAGGSKDDAK